VNERVNIPPIGQSSPLGAKFTPGKTCSKLASDYFNLQKKHFPLLGLVLSQTRQKLTKNLRFPQIFTRAQNDSKPLLSREALPLFCRRV
jgi:hypothetical protein